MRFSTLIDWSFHLNIEAIVGLLLGFISICVSPENGGTHGKGRDGAWLVGGKVRAQSTSKLSLQSYMGTVHGAPIQV